MAHQYYYFVSSLPDLRLDDYKEPYRVEEFVAELETVLYPCHRTLVDQVLSFYDRANLVDILKGQRFNMLETTGILNLETIKQTVRGEISGDSAWLDSFLEIFKELAGEKKNDRSFLETFLWEHFYQEMTRHENAFVRRYFRFDLSLRNILIALNKRMFKLSEGLFIECGDDFVVHKLKTSNLPDFGLSGDLSYVNRLVDIFHRRDFVAAEKFVDFLKWQKIDELNTFNFFSIDVVLGFLLKLFSCERWICLESKRGREILEEHLKIT